MLQAEAIAAAVERSRPMQSSAPARTAFQVGVIFATTCPGQFEAAAFPEFHFGTRYPKYTVNTGTWHMPAATRELLIFRDGPKFATCRWAATASPPSGEF
jgi:hypothetical protein